MTRALVAAAAVASLGVLSAPPRKPVRAETGLALPRKEVLHVLGASHQNLLADYYWLMTIQQTGKAVTREEHRDIASYAQLTTDLDPAFYSPYLFAAIGCPLNLGRETWVHADESSALLRKGLLRFPDDLALRFQLAYNLTFLHRDFKAAADLYGALATHPRTPPHLAQLATRLYAQTGNFDLAVEVARSMRDAAQDDQTRAIYEKRLLEIELEQILQKLDVLVRDFHTREGRWPSLKELVSTGALPSIPVDPLGGEIYLDEKGRPHSSAQRFRLQLIEERLKYSGEQP